MNASALTAADALPGAPEQGPTTTTPTVISVVDPLAHAFADGDERALEAAYRTHSGIVYGMAARALPRADAEDVLQAVFVAAWRGRATFDPSRGELRGWLVGITRFRIADALSARSRRGEVLVAQADKTLRAPRTTSTSARPTASRWSTPSTGSRNRGAPWCAWRSSKR